MKVYHIIIIGVAIATLFILNAISNQKYNNLSPYKGAIVRGRDAINGNITLQLPDKGTFTMPINPKLAATYQKGDTIK